MNDTKNPEIVFRELQEADREDVVQRCKELYFAYYGPKEIAQKMDVNYETLRKWVQRYGWREERDQLESDVQSDAVKRRAVETTEIMRDGLRAIKETVSRYQKAGSMDMKDTLALSQLLTNIDKLMRLAEGRATEITEERTLKANLTATTVVDVLQNRDPFAVNLESSKEQEGDGDKE